MRIPKVVPVALILLLPLAAHAATSYKVTAVAPAGSTASALNDRGQVVGDFPSTTSVARYGFITSGSGIINLGPANGSSFAAGVNNSGVVVGNASGSETNYGVAFYAGPGIPMKTFNPFSGYHSQGRGINDSGVIVGWGDDFTNNHAFILSHGHVKDLLPLGAVSANAINRYGQVAGNTDTQAYRYGSGVLTRLGTLGGTYSWATAINDGGAVAGYSTIDPGNGRTHAFLYEKGGMKDLGTLGLDHVEAYGINNAGQVVGYTWSESAPGDERAWLYSSGVMRDLNTLIKPGCGWKIIRAMDINNKGQIAATAMKGGVTYAVRLDP